MPDLSARVLGFPVLIFVLAAGMARAEGGVYIAGQGFTLEQAVEQAQSEQVGDTMFWIVASGQVARDVADAENRPDTARLLEQVRERGGLVTVCAGDLGSSGASEAGQATPPGVALVPAPGDPAPGLTASDQSDDVAMPESDRQRRLILRACAALQ